MLPFLIWDELPGQFIPYQKKPMTEPSVIGFSADIILTFNGSDCNTFCKVFLKEGEYDEHRQYSDEGDGHTHGCTWQVRHIHIGSGLGVLRQVLDIGDHLV